MRSRVARLIHHRYFGSIVVGIIVIGLIAFASSVYVAGQLEQQDSFCGSCHTEPETTYLMRFSDASTSGNPVDLASFHHNQVYPPNSPNAMKVRCIDCHVGEGVFGRGIVLSLSAWDALRHFSGTADQPAYVIFTVQNEACLKCHLEQVSKNLDKPLKPFVIDNHYHYRLLLDSSPYERCVDCHVAHQPASEATQFQLRKDIIPVCQDCHQKEGHGPLKF